MVHLTELRIVMPFTVEEFRRGQRYGNWKTNEDSSEEGQGGVLLSSIPIYDEVFGEGLFTHSLYRLGNRLPEWVTQLVPANALVVEEKSWITFPYTRTVLTIPWFTKLKYEILSLHLDDDGSTPNALSLSPSDLEMREVEVVDIGAEKVAKRDYKEHLDPAKVRPSKLGRGPLKPGWQKEVRPLMCAYKVVRAEADYWGVATRAEKLMISSVRQIFLLAHKNCFGYADQWFDRTYQQIMDLERPGRERLQELSPPAPASEEHSAGEWGSGREADDTDLTFFEAQMEWAAQEDISGDSAFSGGSDPPPRVCPLCAPTRPPEVFCSTCGEFFCAQCFRKMHCTARLAGHTHRDLTTPPSPAPPSAADGGRGVQLRPPASGRWQKANHAPLNASGPTGPTEAFEGSAVQLAAEMVAKMIAIYRRMEDMEQLTRKGGGGMGEIAAADPYGIGEEGEVIDTGVYRSLVHVEGVRGVGAEDEEMRSYEHLASQLVGIHPSCLLHDERLPFWINVYNALLMHAYLVYGVPCTHYKRVLLMQKAGYAVGGMLFCVLAIEHNVLRGATFHPALAGILPVQRFKPSDERRACILARPEPLVSFALACGARSSPVVRIYSAAGIRAELQVAARDYLGAAVRVGSKLHLPKILHWYGKDFGANAGQLLQWVADHMPEERKMQIVERLQSRKGHSKMTTIVSYDWTPRYLLLPE